MKSQLSERVEETMD